MNNPRKFDFKKHTSPSAPKNYLIRVLFYVLILSLLGYLMFNKYKNRGAEKQDSIEEINSVIIDNSDSL